MQSPKFCVLISTFIAALPVLAQQPPSTQQPMPMPPGHSMQLPAQCQAMMQKMQSMHTAQKAMDDRLTALVAEMNTAKGSARVDRMAAVINEMVTQRKRMRDEMTAMMPDMMNHMMQHMQNGMMSGMQSMANCPMMSGSNQPSQPANTEHKH